MKRKRSPRSRRRSRESELDDARVKYLGRKSELAQALRGVRDRESGMLLNGVRAKLEEAVAAREAELVRARVRAGRRVGRRRHDPRHPVERGRLHLLTQIRREIEDIFLGMGYEVWDGNEVATVWENFDALTSDPGHPSRSQFDTFYIDDGHGAAHAHLAGPDPRDAAAQAADLHGLAGPLLPPRHA